MLSAYQRHLIWSYLVNIARILDREDPAAVVLMSWTAENAALFDFVPRKKTASPVRRRSRRNSYSDTAGTEPSADEWTSFLTFVEERVRATKRARPDLPARRLAPLAKITGISPTDIRILEALLLYETNPVIESLIDDIFGRATRRHRFDSRTSALPFILDLSPYAVSARLKPEAPLVRSGLVSVDNDGDLSLAKRLSRLAFVTGTGDPDVRNLLLRRSDPAELEWADFDHIADDRDHIRKLLQGAMRSGEAGVNILLYGPPGTGKTQCCRILAERLGVRLYGAGESDEDGGEPCRSERLGDLRLAQCLLARDRRSLLIFDEMEDLLPNWNWPFPSGRESRNTAHGGSKLFMNRLIETAPVPTLWTANSLASIPPFLLRRMKFALELRLPPPRIRARIWSRQLARNGIQAGPGEALSLATSFEAPPGVAAEVTAAARLTGGDIASVRQGLKGLARALRCEKPKQNHCGSFDLSLLHADSDLTGLADRIVAGVERHFSLCLQGPPGTGKSAYVRYLADRLELEVMQKRTSDLLSPWVGGTEKNIALAFREARDDEAFLVFDEADSLLADRRYAVRNWEVSQTNEMLAWMEAHPLPFACTTNFGSHLDPATLRRFVFKIALDYMSREQVTSAFRAFFDLDAPEEVGMLSALTPGDFIVVRRKAEILCCLGKTRALAELLRKECDAKPVRSRPIGFQA